MPYFSPFQGWVPFQDPCKNGCVAQQERSLTVQAPKSAQTWDPTTTNCVLHQLPNIPVVKAPVSILTRLVGMSDSHVRNSAQFGTVIAGQVTVLVSFDVISLFTNVPIDLAVQVAHERPSADTSLAERTALSADQVANLFHFCLDATFLAYRGEYYQ